MTTLEQWTTPTTSRTRQVRLAETVAAELRERILNGVLPAGMLPKQDQLIEMFGVSGPSLREALRILEVEGLITVRRGKVGGAEFHRPDGSSAAYAIGLTLHGERTRMQDLAESIRMFEPACAVSAAEDPAVRAALADRLDANVVRARAALGEGPKLTKLAREYHELLVDAVPNPAIRLVVESLETVWSAQEETWATELQAAGRFPDEASQLASLKAHQRIADAIRAGDAAEVRRLCTGHIEAAHQSVLAHVGGRLVDAASPQAIESFRRVSKPRSGVGG